MTQNKYPPSFSPPRAWSLTGRPDINDGVTLIREGAALLGGGDPWAPLEAWEVEWAP